MNKLKNIFLGAVGLGAISLGVGCGLAYISGDFNESFVPVATITALGTIIGGCFGAMANNVRHQPKP